MYSEYKVGQICVVIDSPDLGEFSFAVGRELTILEGLDWRGGFAREYAAELQGYGIVTVQHHVLRPKKPPESDKDQEAFRDFMDKILIPMPVEMLENV